ncbi:MAG: hypothetical protein NWF05_03375 [Candidatus Bathyarchaeota archaeon]|nr:hypothetical protein [Candidatus Bathyarchaeota archaeon]
MKLLVSPLNEHEALEAVAGGADIIDVKNPKEGSLGANFPWVIKRIRQITPPNIEVSCTLGDLPNLPGSASIAAFGAASLGVNYVKASLFGLKNSQEAIFMMENVVRAVKECDPTIKVVAAGFADAQRVGSVDPFSVPEIASASGCSLAMLDTAVKDGKTLLDFLSPKQLKEFIVDTHSYGLEVALAGSLKAEQLPVLCALEPEIIGVRGAACVDGDRVEGHITKQRVHELVQILKNCSRPCRAAVS